VTYHFGGVCSRRRWTRSSRSGTCGQRPFAGTYVPLRYYRTDLRVESLMVEVRRDAYLGERADRRPGPIGSHSLSIGEYDDPTGGSSVCWGAGGHIPWKASPGTGMAPRLFVERIDESC
jgi:hypothetical protein